MRSRHSARSRSPSALSRFPRACFAPPIARHNVGKKPIWFENDGRAERPGLKGLAVPALNSNCLPLIKSP